MAISMQLFGFAAIFLLQASVQANLGIGQCPSTIKTIEDFCIENYLGLWYEYAKYPSPYAIGAKCITDEYGFLDNGGFTVFTRQISKFTGTEKSVSGYVAPDECGESGKFTIYLPGFLGETNAPYWILDTDYVNYAVVYSCSTFGPFNTKYVWIVTREQNPCEEVIEKAKEALIQQYLSVEKLVVTDQSNCQVNK